MIKQAIISKVSISKVHSWKTHPDLNTESVTLKLTFFSLTTLFVYRFRVDTDNLQPQEMRPESSIKTTENPAVLASQPCTDTKRCPSSVLSVATTASDGMATSVVLPTKITWRDTLEASLWSEFIQTTKRVQVHSPQQELMLPNCYF